MATGARIAVLAAAALSVWTGDARGHVPGVNGPAFNLTAKAGYISTPEGGSVYTWGYANGAGLMQYPGPTLIVRQGDTVTVNLTNELDVPVSIVFPGQAVTAAGGTAGLVTREAAPSGGTVTYTFVASRAGTYQYHSGTNMALQVEMGLVGALLVFPPESHQAYSDPASAYDQVTLFLLTEMDPVIHELVETGRTDEVDFTYYRSTYWFINGRCAPDTMAGHNVPWLPHQPYGCLPRMHPGERLLLRIVSAGRDLHPFHTHGNHMTVIARDGRLVTPEKRFTLTIPPGGTADAIFEWTGAGLGWDIYGHAPGDPLQPNENAADHGKPFPVTLPEPGELTWGFYYSGSPFLGAHGYRPPGDDDPNHTAGYYYMWHSHKEMEMVNNDVFPGGMMTMLVIEHPSVAIIH
jgi:FtsP/CotA-like multicopper oxidase with cupredoxin domain